MKKNVSIEKNMKIRNNIIVVALFAVFAFATTALARDSKIPASKEIPTVTSDDNNDIFDKTIEQNILSPKVGSGQKAVIADFQKRQAKELIEKGYEMSSLREGLVIVATIVADRLFLPNDTLMRASAQPIIKPFAHFMKDFGMWKVLLVMHSDNTGSPKYLRKLTVARVDAVYDWLYDKSDHPEELVPYGIGGVAPLYPNNSMENRAKNRRLEIYLIPGEKMIKLAKENKLK